jgi:hypothetical protein
MAGELQKNVFEVGQDGSEVGDSYPVLGKTLDYLAHEIVAKSANREL